MTDAEPRILLVDDDRQLGAMLREFLELQGFQVDVLQDGQAALDRIDQDPPDLMVLDVMLPGINGFDVLRQLREKHQLPVIMLTARGEESERILGLMGGADDYLPKPCNPLELTARIQAVLKRSMQPAPAEPEALVLQLGPLEMDCSRRTLSAHGKPVKLTAGEMRLLEQLMRHPGQVMSRGQLTQLALDRPLEAYDRSIDTLISKLRKKLAATGIPREIIRGLRGHGYVIDDTFGQDD
ncbi:MAG: response regulator transcription factor [Chromatiales bacterium]|nr:MAG: response regulator transcription factor [Chromatiales bacterium]